MRLLKKYKHGLIILIYAISYMICFSALEGRDDVEFHMIPTPLDEYIPFCEYFIVPYLFWFVYMFITVLFFIFINPSKNEYYQLIFNLMTGMTIFLFISFIYPNGVNIRPPAIVRDNIFSDIVKILYRSDTSTNVFPSIHVFNSVAIHTAISQSHLLEQDRWLKWASLLLTSAIIASTIFLKQHSILDVIGGIILASGTYYIFYKSKLVSRLPN